MRNSIFVAHQQNPFYSCSCILPPKVATDTQFHLWTNSVAIWCYCRPRPKSKLHHRSFSQFWPQMAEKMCVRHTALEVKILNPKLKGRGLPIIDHPRLVPVPFPSWSMADLAAKEGKNSRLKRGTREEPRYETLGLLREGGKGTSISDDRRGQGAGRG